MPRRNRVTPFGEIVAEAARGAFMGNRGVLHTPAGVLTAAWRHPHWIICELAFKGRKRPLAAPGRYTELFFCDEATALAAGHRPCWECRRADARRFAAAWRDAHGLASISAKEMDAALHAARLTADGRQKRRAAALRDLPDGVMVMMNEEPGAAWLVWRGRLRRWSPSGYGDARPIVGDAIVEVCTPEPTMRAIAAGYAPQTHPSVAQASDERADRAG
jgi:hypothetical protein